MTGGWASRGYLPHFDVPGLVQHVTFCLGDALPRDVVDRWRDALLLKPDGEREAELRRRIERYCDAGHGGCLLREPAVASIVEGILLRDDGHGYALLGWVIMPNHVHVLVEAKMPLAKMVQTWKSVSAHRLGRGSIRQREYWDRSIRDERHFRQTLTYIHDNPVKAGLCAMAKDWVFSSAWRERDQA